MQDLSSLSEILLESEAPTLISLGKPLISEIFSHLDPTSLQRLRLVNKRLNSIVDEGVTTFRYGDPVKATDHLQIEADLAHACRLWPSIKELHFSFPRNTSRDRPPEERSNGDRAANALIDTFWTDIEIINFDSCGLGSHGGAVLGLACARHWRRLRRIKLGNNAISHDFWCEFLQGEYRFLEEIDLTNNYAGSAAGAPLDMLGARCPNLRVLNLHLSHLRADGLAKLSECDIFQALEVLDLYGSNLKGDVAGIALAKLVSRCPQLKNLNLGWNNFSNELLSPFLQVKLDNLEVIDISSNSLDDTIASRLAAAHWPQLRELRISFNAFTPEGIHALCRGNWPLLEILDVSYNVIAREGAEGLRDAACGSTPRWPCLHSLYLGGRSLNAIALHALLEGEWKALTYLSLQDNDIDVECAEVLAAGSSHLSALKYLDISETMKNESEYQMFLSGTWSSLECIVLGGVQVTPASIQAFAAGLKNNRLPALRRLEFFYFSFKGPQGEALFACLWPQLEELSLRQCSIGVEVATALAQAAEGMTHLRCLTIEDDIYTEDEVLGGEEGIMIVLSACWPSLERVLLWPCLLSTLPEGVSGWQLAGVDEEKRTILQRIELKNI